MSDARGAKEVLPQEDEGPRVSEAILNESRTGVGKPLAQPEVGDDEQGPGEHVFRREGETAAPDRAVASARV